MKRSAAIVVVTFAALTCWTSTTSAQQVTPYFSPRGGCAAAIVQAIDAAQSSVHVQAYYLTHPNIIAALANASHRNLAVTVIMDAKTSRRNKPAMTILPAAGCAVALDAQEKIAHNKVIIIDDHTVITGSFNFSLAADTDNAENIVVIVDKSVNAAYLANFRKHLVHSIKLLPPGSNPPPSTLPSLRPR